MSASGRTKVASDVKFGVGASSIELYLCSKFGDPSSYGVPTPNAEAVTTTAKTTEYAAYAINAISNSGRFGR